MTRQSAIACTGSLALLVAAGAAHASCGTAFCVLNTNWSTQGVAAEPGTARLDLRYEFVEQKHLQSGTKRVSTDDVAAEETTELRTINRNLLTTLDYAFSKNWAVSVSAPVISRSHSHIDNATGETEKWDFTKVGDTRVLGFYRFDNEKNPVVSHGLIFGLKLPTGKYRVGNDDGVEAERSLQPGTGSTDLVLGGYYSAPGPTRDSSWFAQVLVQQAVSTKDEFKPGGQFQLNLGYSHPLSNSLQGLVQVNALIKRSDSGANSEPDLSGSRSVFLSPGLAYSLTHDSQLYSFVQLPIYRYYNGIQLSVDWAFVAGFTTRF
jgi:hypothetical protein